MGCSEEEAKRVAQMFNCNIGQLPLKYLGVMVYNRHMTFSNLNYVAIKVENGESVYMAECWLICKRENDISGVLPKLSA